MIKKIKKIGFWMLFLAMSLGASAQNSFKKIKQKAEQGNAKAQFSLGKMYVEGKGVSKDFKKAAYWCKKAAKQGYAKAQFYLGGMYFEGEGVLKDKAKAKYWIQKAYENDDPEFSKKAKEFWDKYELWKY